jgi:hypothetical protein
MRAFSNRRVMGKPFGDGIHFRFLPASQVYPPTSHAATSAAHLSVSLLVHDYL